MTTRRQSNTEKSASETPRSIAARAFPRNAQGVFIKRTPSDSSATTEALSKLATQVAADEPDISKAGGLKPDISSAGRTLALKQKTRAVSRVKPKIATRQAAADPPAAERQPPKPKRSSRKTLVARVSKSIERELFAVEQLLADSGALPAQDAETERRARTLASLARSLREISQLNPSDGKPKTSDDNIPRDVDELRRELARRLDVLIAEAKTVHPDEAEGVSS